MGLHLEDPIPLTQNHSELDTRILVPVLKLNEVRMVKGNYLQI